MCDNPGIGLLGVSLCLLRMEYLTPGPQFVPKSGYMSKHCLPLSQLTAWSSFSLLPTHDNSRGGCQPLELLFWRSWFPCNPYPPSILWWGRCLKQMTWKSGKEKERYTSYQNNDNMVCMLKLHQGSCSFSQKKFKDFSKTVNKIQRQFSAIPCNSRPILQNSKTVFCDSM